MTADPRRGTRDETDTPLDAEAIRRLREAAQGDEVDALRKLDLRGARLAGVDLAELDLSGLDLSGADLTRAQLAGAKLTGANLTRATLVSACLERCELLGARLEQADLSDCRAETAGFGGARLDGARLHGARLAHATLSQAQLRDADLRGADLRDARIRSAQLAGCALQRADLRAAELTGSDVAGASFDGADLRGARLSELAHYEKASWIHADVREADFRGGYELRRFILDENYLYEFRTKSRRAELVYRVWWLTSDCGRSFSRLGLWIVLILAAFAGLYQLVEVDYGDHPTPLSSLYYSVVTLTTLGYGDVVPASTGAQLVAMAEVVVGYLALGGLISIFANKMARRAE